jgi:CxxC motif-containing protein (DUF1111 family)
MNRSYRVWYLLIVLVALVPAGLRVLALRPPQPQEVDPAMAQAGQALFTHVWKVKDALTPAGDGLGPVFNANSCAACHNQGGIGGAGGLEHNVTTYTVRADIATGKPREGVVHTFAVNRKFQETLALVDGSLPNTSQPELRQLVAVGGDSRHCLPMPPRVHVSQRNTPALFGAKLIDDIPERVLVAEERSQRLRSGMAASQNERHPVGRALRLVDGRIGRFGWKAQMASLSDFVQAACANELGLGNPGQPQPRPIGQPDYQPVGLDLTLEQCDQLTAFVASLPRPIERLPVETAAREKAEAGKRLFGTVGCADCHKPDLGSVEGIYSDLLLHRMGPDTVGGGSYGDRPPDLPAFPPGSGPQPDEWRTPPLWGVADSAPYLHDGRAATLADAIRLHGGQAAETAQRFTKLSKAEQDQVHAFLNSLRAP